MRKNSHTYYFNLESFSIRITLFYQVELLNNVKIKLIKSWTTSHFNQQSKMSNNKNRKYERPILYNRESKWQLIILKGFQGK